MPVSSSAVQPGYPQHFATAVAVQATIAVQPLLLPEVQLLEVPLLLPVQVPAVANLLCRYTPLVLPVCSSGKHSSDSAAWARCPQRFSIAVAVHLTTAAEAEWQELVVASLPVLYTPFVVAATSYRMPLLNFAVLLDYLQYLATVVAVAPTIEVAHHRLVAD